jgi:hypothetical protein
MALQLVEVLIASPQVSVDVGLAAVEAVDHGFQAKIESSLSISDGARHLREGKAMLVFGERLRVLKSSLKWTQGRREIGAFKLVG